MPPSAPQSPASPSLAPSWAEPAPKEPRQGDLYKPAQGIIETFRLQARHGYFAQPDGTCAMTLFLAEDQRRRHRVPTAARVRVNVKAGDKAELGSVEGQSVEIVCGSERLRWKFVMACSKAAYVHTVNAGH